MRSDATLDASSAVGTTTRQPLQTLGGKSRLARSPAQINPECVQRYAVLNSPLIDNLQSLFSVVILCFRSQEQSSSSSIDLFVADWRDLLVNPVHRK